MTDLDVIREIERQIEIPLKKVAEAELLEKPFDVLRAYATDNNGNLTGLRLDYTGFASPWLLTGVSTVQTLRLQACWALENFAFLKELKGLTTLDLSYNKITDGYFLKELEGLTTLGLGFNQITDGAFFKELKGLTMLDLRGNQISNGAFLKKLKGLTTLNLYNNQISDWAFLKELKSLTTLDLGSNKIFDGSFLKELKGLTTLELSGNQISDWNFLKELKSLTKLYLSNSKISDGAFLKELKGLITLYLNDNQISDGAFLKELKSLITLDLGSNKISDGSFLKELKSLNILDFSGNQISDWGVLKELKSLTWLDLGSNKISSGAFLKEFKGLTTLYLSDNQISDWDFLKELKSLTRFDLSNNQISDGSFLKELKGLTRLDLSNNQISDGSFLKELKGLNTLVLSGNKIFDWNFLKELKSLNTLDLGSNKISDGSFLKPLKSLTVLYVRENNLVDLAFVADLPNLGLIYFYDQKNLNDPPEQVREQGVGAIRSYYLQQRQAGQARIYEAKALLVGDPGAGKTSLMNKLLDHEYVVDPGKKHEATLGIDIRQNWRFNWTEDKSGSTEFNGHLWDFGGHDIQYYIHQFFLTEGSLYILLVDDRQDAQNIDYWLNIIKLLGKGSPVLLVRNQKNIKSATGFEQNKYVQRYGAFFEIHFRDVNLVADENELRFLEIEALAQKLLSTLPHVDQELPTTYVRVRAELEKRREAKENHIALAEFQKICTDNSIPKEQDQQVLRRYLHQLGVILHYENDSALADTVFLNPHWITKAVYSILSDKELENSGKFNKEWFFSKLPEPDYKLPERHKILLLMQKKEFELVYQLDSAEDTYLAPRLLPNKAPDAANAWQQQGALSFRYRYKFMPVGIINRLVVRLSSLIAEDEHRNDLVWQEGAILQKNNCRARVKEDLTRDGLKVIDISVTGDSYERRQLLGHIRENLEGIHRDSFKGLEIEELVPCCCAVCVEASEPTFFEFSELQNYVNGDEIEIKCARKDGVRPVQISELLEGVVHTEERWHGRRIFRDKFDELIGNPWPNKQLDKIEALLIKLESSRGGDTHNYYDRVGVASPGGEVSTENINFDEKSENGKKPFLDRTKIVLGIVVAIITTTLAILKYFNDQKMLPAKPAIVREAPADSSKADTTKKIAGKIKQSP